MKIAVSNIAWAPAERRNVYAVMQRHGAKGLEIAPGLLFPDETDPFAPSDAAVTAMYDELSEFDLTLVSMQSLLFGVQGAALFGSEDERQAFGAGLRRAIDLAGRIDIPNLVMGSPKQRVVPDGMSLDAAFDLAADLFRRLGDAAAAKGTVIAMEPNPAAYGANFLTDFDSALRFVGYVDHPAVTFNFDIGALHMNDAFDRVGDYARTGLARTSHVHVSEPHLAPAPRDSGEAGRLLSALGREGYKRWVSIEMRAVEGGAVAAVDAALGRLMAARAQAEQQAGRQP